MSLADYTRPWFLPNGHLETIWPSLFRKVPSPAYRRQRIDTSDDDFLDLDWLQSGNRRLVIISHGLEGDSGRHYVMGMANAFYENDWDVLAWNFRGCSGEINRQPKFTHNGATEDLHAVVKQASNNHKYESIALVGFSMGGNLSLVYLGLNADMVPEQVKAAVCFSVPCDLAAASAKLAETENALYMKRFMRLMGAKVRMQSMQFPQLFPCDDYEQLKTFHDFDRRYTAPLHNFHDEMHYWQECSCLRYLEKVRIPAWIINARNDPFLAPTCYPGASDHGNALVRLVVPEHGGHCGFTVAQSGSPYWSESVAVSLLAGC